MNLSLELVIALLSPIVVFLMGSSVKILKDLSTQVQDIRISLAVIAQKVVDHETRIKELENS